MHLISQAPQLCISIVFNFSWDGSNAQEKWKTKVMQNLGGGAGGGDNVHYGKCGSGLCSICAFNINQYCYSFKIFLHL